MSIGRSVTRTERLDRTVIGTKLGGRLNVKAPALVHLLVVVPLFFPLQPVVETTDTLGSFHPIQMFPVHLYDGVQSVS